MYKGRAARRFDAVLLVRHNDKVAEFEVGRGVRVVHGTALEKRLSIISGRGFESHPLRLPLRVDTERLVLSLS